MSGPVLIGASGWLGGSVRKRLPDAPVVSAQDVLVRGPAALRPLLVGDHPVVINVAGVRHGDRETLWHLNADLPGILTEEITRVQGHLVHLGSAAEYGTAQRGGLCREEAVPAPESEYGRSKLAGTLRALASDRATVLRVFNVAADRPQPGSPLSDVLERLRAGVALGQDIELLASSTVRDWVRPEFVCDSVVWAAAHAPIGVFNVCSGVGVPIGDVVQEAARLLGSRSRVKDLGAFPPSTVIGSPDRWHAVSGLSEHVTTALLAWLLSSAAAARSPDMLHDEGGLGGGS